MLARSKVLKEAAKLASMGPSRKFFEDVVSGAVPEALTCTCQEASLLLLAGLCRCPGQQEAGLSKELCRAMALASIMAGVGAVACSIYKL